MLRMKGIRTKGDHHTRTLSCPTGSPTSWTDTLRSHSVVITRGQDGTIPSCGEPGPVALPNRIKIRVRATSLSHE